jgi:alkanesulfonate monooxygenase SsuD/methylene tetrahydromethanopterin reductase-like flavin-dependent oxidoreductase (luciferase family)
MTGQRRGVGLTPMETRRDVIVRAAILADELGYEVFAVPEGWGLDAVPVLTEIALRTTGIRLASAIMSVWSRTPAMLAMTAATLHEISVGRFTLGLGTSTRVLAEGFHDAVFEHPAARLRDTVTGVRALLDGQPAQLSRAPDARPLRLGQPAAPDVPIWVAALGQRTCQVAAELADGWIPALVARDHLPGWTARLNQARADRDPPRGPLTVAAGPVTVADENADTARKIAASCVAWYLCAMGDVYRSSVSRQGYAAEVSAILEANPRPSPSRGIVPAAAEAVLDQLAVYGTPGQVAGQLQAWDRASDIVTILLPPGLPWPAIAATVRAAAPGVLAPGAVPATSPAEPAGASPGRA